VLRLPQRQQLLAVDADGRRALALGWEGIWPRLIELGAPRGGQRLAPQGHGPGPQLTRRAVVRADDEAATGELAGLLAEEPGGIRRLPGPLPAVPRLFAISEDERLAAVVAGRRWLRIFELDGQAADPTTAADEVLAVAVCGELALAVVAGRGWVGLVEAGGDVELLRTGRGAIPWVAIAAGRLLLLDEHGLLQVRCLRLGRPAREPALRLAVGGATGPVCVSPDGRLVALADGELLRVLPVARGARPQVLRVHRERLELLRFVRGGRLLLSADAAGVVVLWPRQGDRVVERGPLEDAAAPELDARDPQEDACS